MYLKKFKNRNFKEKPTPSKTNPAIYLSINKIWISILFLCANVFGSQMNSVYPDLLEKILFYKNDTFKVFYGGPITRNGAGVRWFMPAMFENDHYETRAVYEIAFVNCDVTNAQNAEILFIDVSDINIKFRNQNSKDYEVFSHLINGRYNPEKKYIVVRCSDKAIVFYPDVFIRSITGDFRESDRKTIATFLSEKFQTKKEYQNYYSGENTLSIEQSNDSEIIYKPQIIEVKLKQNTHSFNLTEIIRKNDPWKVYYVISLKPFEKIRQNLTDPPILIRFDSGCISGQIYDDLECDCWEQLYESLEEIVQHQDGILIHIPAHDGRGFGTAPKAETEIYKHGGKGRVHTTPPLDTICAAKMLYQTDDFDIRTFDGAVEILKNQGIQNVILLTDNVFKLQTLEKHGFVVHRQKTTTSKHSCLIHSQAKKQDNHYFPQ
jgi:GTP cyclohydrolase II